ncbi:MAG: peptidylprolyl isomerase [candidate division Zixibacteria bacterium]
MKALTIISGVALLMLLLTMGCSMNPTAKDGDTVKVHYVGTLDDGSEFDSSRGRDPLEFTIGKPGIIEGFSNGVLGMTVGETKKITLPPEEAYGQPRPDMIQEVPLSSFPETITPEVGVELSMQNASGQPFPVKITAMADSTATLDANHPLAGKTLTFELELIEIVADTTGE